MNRLYTLFIIALFLVSCKKGDNSNDSNKNDPSKLTEQILTTNGNAQRVWNLFQMNVKYLSPAGTTDSTFDMGPIYDLYSAPQQIRFSIGPDVLTGNNSERTFDLYTNPGVLDRVFQGIGLWTLSSDGKALTCGIFTPRPVWSTGGLGGTFSATYNGETGSPFPLSKSLGLKVTQTFPDNRKAEVSVILASN